MTHYLALGLPTAYVPAIIIKEYFKALAAKYSTADKYPDLGQPLTETAIKWVAIQEAYTTLSDENKRAAYDQALVKIKTITNLLAAKKYATAKQQFDTLEESMPTLFSKSPSRLTTLLANDDLQELANIATHIAVYAVKTAENNTKRNSKSENDNLLKSAEKYYRFADEMHKCARLDKNRSTEFEIISVSNLCNFLHARAKEAQQTGKWEYADCLIQETEQLLNDFIPFDPKALVHFKENEDMMIDAGLEFFEVNLFLGIAYQTKGQTFFAKKYLLQSIEICSQLKNAAVELENQKIILEYEAMAVRKFSELNFTADTQLLVDRRMQQYDLFNNTTKQHFLFILQRLLSAYVSECRWELAKNNYIYVFMLLKNVLPSEYSIAFLLHLDCAIILEKDLCCLNNHTQTQDTASTKKPSKPRNSICDIANILHHYRTAMNYAIYSRKLDSAMLACNKTARFYLTLSQHYPSDRTNYRTLAEFFHAMTHFNEAKMDNKTFQKIQKCYEKNRSTANLRYTFLQICLLYKNKYMNSDDPQFVNSEQFNNFIDALRQQGTLSLPFWKDSTTREQRTKRQHDHEQKKPSTHTSNSSQVNITQTKIVIHSSETTHQSYSNLGSIMSYR